MDAPKAIRLDLPRDDDALESSIHVGSERETGPESTRLDGEHLVVDETERTRLIEQLSNILRSPRVPEATRTAGLTLIGWLARRMPGEVPHDLGVAEARASERRMRTAPRSEE